MRSFLAGLLLLALSSAIGFGQVRGEVESIGFGNGWYRPQCWTPMVVRLQSQISEPAEYRIEVHQHDLDFDHVIYAKGGITLNGQATQRWELCFLPEPIQNGLPEGSVRDLQDRLRVYLTNKEGTRQIIQLPITSPVQSLEAQPNMGFGVGKASKLILVVSDGSSRPAFSEASYDKALGLVEKPQPVPVRPAGLPQSALAYEAVDAVLWISGDAHVLSEEGSKQLTALQQYVRQGGTLVVCQPPNDAERQKIEPFAAMLPIEWKENGEWKVTVQDRDVKTKDDLQPLVSYAARKVGEWPSRVWNLKGKFPVARATTRPSAIVDTTDWIAWDKEGKDQTPYLARIPYGLGCVTWVAQDLGNPAITGPNTAGWPYVWDHIFAWGNDTRLANDQTVSDQSAFGTDGMSGSSTDIGPGLNKGVEFTSKGTGLIALAVLFFIVYWLVAGPGLYLVLANKKRKELSWAAFGAAALAATLLTVLVVRVVLRGSPEIHHATDIRFVSGQEAQPAIAYSKIGLYIPRDGDQQITLTDTSSQFISYLSPMEIAPVGGENDFPATLDYQVPVPDTASPEGVSISVPFRSTLKKLQAQWAGDSSKTIRGNGVQLILDANPKDMLKGTVDNLTGVNLHNVYIAFHNPSGQNFDYVIYVPGWASTGAGARLDLARLLMSPQVPFRGNTQLGKEPGGDTACWGNIPQQLAFSWHKNLEPGSGPAKVIDDLAHAPFAFAVLSLFDRIPPARKDNAAGTDAYTLLRRGARNLDMSPAMAAGEMVVIALADAQPLPFPLEVNGNRVGGDGTVFFQFALPLERVGSTMPGPAEQAR
jgi:hypothetical protein